MEKNEPSSKSAYVEPRYVPRDLGWAVFSEESSVAAARVGLGASAAVLGVGSIVFGISFVPPLCVFAEECPPPSWQYPVRITGGILMAGAASGMIVSGVLLGIHKKRLRSLRASRWAKPRRARWDLATSELVF
jgi:hypothetical protein